MKYIYQKLFLITIAAILLVACNGIGATNNAESNRSTEHITINQLDDDISQVGARLDSIRGNTLVFMFGEFINQSLNIQKWKGGCSGLLLNEKVILTAAHCVMNFDKYKNMQMLLNDDWNNDVSSYVILGKNDIESWVISKNFNKEYYFSDLAIITFTNSGIEKLNDKFLPDDLLSGEYSILGYLTNEETTEKKLEAFIHLLERNNSLNDPNYLMANFIRSGTEVEIKTKKIFNMPISILKKYESINVNSDNKYSFNFRLPNIWEKKVMGEENWWYPELIYIKSDHDISIPGDSGSPVLACYSLISGRNFKTRNGSDMCELIGVFSGPNKRDGEWFERISSMLNIQFDDIISKISY